jgi:hypothetical protein
MEINCAPLMLRMLEWVFDSIQFHLLLYKPVTRIDQKRHS